MLKYTSQILNNFKPLQSSLLAAKLDVFTQPSRNTYIFKRKYAVPLHKKNQRPPALKAKHMVYEVLEGPHTKKQKLILVKLKEDVRGFGRKGDILELKSGKAYEQLLLPKLADYLTPEELEEYRNQPKDLHGPTSATYVRNMLSTQDLSITMSPVEPWTLEKWHVSVSFRKCGFHVPEDAITLPEKPISGPNKELQNKVFLTTIRINDETDVKVKCRIHHIDVTDMKKVRMDKKKQIPTWLTENVAIFPEEQELIDQLPLHRLIEMQSV